MIGYLDKVIRPLVLVLPETCVYVKVKDGEKIKTINWCLSV